MNKYVKSYRRNISGVILPLTALLAVTIVSLAGVGVDISYQGIVRSSVEKATEAASIAGAQEFFRSGADAGKAINASLRVFKMNVSDDTNAGDYYPSTGSGQRSTLTHSKTFTEQDSISGLYRGRSIKVTVVTDSNRGKVSVTSEITAKPLFAQVFGKDEVKINLTKHAELPPYDVVFVVDESGSMRFSTFYTYIGTAIRNNNLVTDVVLAQTKGNNPPRTNELFNVNGFTLRVVGITDVLITTPGLDIPTNASYSNGSPVYINDPNRGVIVNTNRSVRTLRRTALTGYRISELAGVPVSAEDRVLAQTFVNHGSSGANFNNYFNMAANFIEPHAGAVYGVMSFVDTVRSYGTSALKLGLVTFSTNSYTSNMTFSVSSDLEKNNSNLRLRNEVPYINLVNPGSFDSIVDVLTIMSTGSGTGSPFSPLDTNSYPDGGTNINQGLINADRMLDRSDRNTSSEKIIILFTDGQPTHSFTALGNRVKSITDDGIRVYSIVLTLDMDQSTINNFRSAMEDDGNAEPVIFIDDPAQLDDAFIQIADDLGLKLVS